MFTQEIMDKIFAHKDMKKVPVGYQMAVYRIIEEVLENTANEFPYTNLFQLFQKEV